MTQPDITLISKSQLIKPIPPQEFPRPKTYAGLRALLRLKGKEETAENMYRELLEK